MGRLAQGPPKYAPRNGSTVSSSAGPGRETHFGEYISQHKFSMHFCLRAPTVLILSWYVYDIVELRFLDPFLCFFWCSVFNRLFVLYFGTC